MYELVTLIIIFIVIFFWVAFLFKNSFKKKKINDKKIKIAKKNFKKSKTLQNTPLHRKLTNTHTKAWTISDIKKKQGQKDSDLASKKDKINNISGIYGFFIEDNIGNDDYFIPLYIGKSRNIRERWIQHANKIEKAYQGCKEAEIKYQKIAHYLKLKQKTPNCIRFIVIEKINTSKYNYLCKSRERHWINLSGAGQRGFNSIKA